MALARGALTRCVGDSNLRLRAPTVSPAIRLVGGALQVPKCGFPCLQRRQASHVTHFTHEFGQNHVQVVEGESPQPDESLSDGLLSELQVQTLEEQARISATPAHPESLFAMYATYVAACFMERVWRFGLPAVISLLSDTLLPVAMLSFVGQLVIFVGGPCVGAFMDSMPRPASFNFLSIVQTFSMVVSAAVVVFALRGGAATASTTGLLLKPWFIILMTFGALERLAGLACGVAFERDWVVQLAGSNRSLALANANAILRRVDLVCEIAGPLLFGILLSRYTPVKCICIAAVAMVTSLPLLIYLVHCTYKLSKGVLDRPKTRNWTESKGYQDQSSEEGFRAIKRGWIQYLSQPILPASVAYVLLYFNAVLGPGSLMTSFLTQQGLNPSIIGSFRGMCALMGFVATFVSSAVIGKLGVLKAGLTALVFQAGLLALAVAVYWSTQVKHQAALITFLVLIVVSRLGFWVYDMVDAQVFQTAVPISQANLVGTTEVSLASLAELVMMGVAIVASEVNHFGGLSALSMVAVVGAAAIYWRWLANPSPEQARLFPGSRDQNLVETSPQVCDEVTIEAYEA
ncbi:solute carrier family 40 member 3, chloroplastic isoform X2 [Selaginella moellendorffii]|uniref:solute carrier family 40 member 3, chloroplastic isoform X2 n=1 Tax=Selaginella moellendorffii TaxID=88036 RepID=UPI000D1C3EF9|nr:solute carrier family 40 member 3, chloroplastic isoform X2 [Selaginella moellendorffii]|eukprot:XP_024529777.1 solute carrier family 40 member 3, chloroplastic isoform X2 [Selaginella moellendorffii]